MKPQERHEGKTALHKTLMMLLFAFIPLALVITLVAVLSVLFTLISTITLSTLSANLLLCHRATFDE